MYGGEWKKGDGVGGEKERERGKGKGRSRKGERYREVGERERGLRQMDIYCHCIAQAGLRLTDTLPYPLKYPQLELYHSTWISILVFMSDWIFGIIILYIFVTVAISLYIIVGGGALEYS